MPDNFKLLLERFDPDPELAGREYKKLHDSLTTFFRNNESYYPEEHTDLALDRLAKRIGEGVAIENVKAYAYQVARYILLETRRKRHQPGGGAELTDDIQLVKPSAEPDDPAKEWMFAKPSGEPDNPTKECLTHCLTKLAPEEQEWILDYYDGEGQQLIDRRKEIGERLGIKMTALKLRAFRVRNRLEDCLLDCLGKNPGPAAETNRGSGALNEGRRNHE